MLSISKEDAEFLAGFIDQWLPVCGEKTAERARTVKEYLTVEAYQTEGKNAVDILKDLAPMICPGHEIDEQSFESAKKAIEQTIEASPGRYTIRFGDKNYTYRETDSPPSLSDGHKLGKYPVHLTGSAAGGGGGSSSSGGAGYYIGHNEPLYDGKSMVSAIELAIERGARINIPGEYIDAINGAMVNMGHNDNSDDENPEYAESYWQDGGDE